MQTILSSPPLHLAILAISWLLYFAIHSLAASLRLKQWVHAHHPEWMPRYRILFNLHSLLLLAIPLYLLHSWRGPLLWEWEGAVQIAMYLLMAGSIALFIYTLRDYDSAEFFGFRQWKNGIHAIEDQEQFTLSPMHRLVRHPWYFLFLVLVWAQEMDGARLLSALLITGYMVIGSRMEEEKLLHYHPEIYPIYRDRVPGLLPNPFKMLTRAEAEQLLNHSRSGA